MNPIHSSASIYTFAALIVLAVSTPVAGESSNAVESSQSRTYRWFNESTPAGEQKVVQKSTNYIVSDMRIQWNNRDFTLHNEMWLDEMGFVRRQLLTGQSAFGATIRESFQINGSDARWQSTADSGSLKIKIPSFYVPERTGATESIAALIRKGLNSPDGKVPLLPSGEAQVHRVADTEVSNGQRSVKVHLYVITGLQFAPIYAWLDDNNTLFSHGFWGLTMIPDGWDSAVIDELAEIQSRHELLHFSSVAEDSVTEAHSGVVIEAVDVVDVAGGRIIPGQYVTIRGGIIVEITSSNNTTGPELRVDGRGKTLLPGLWDMHAHTDFYSYYGGIMNIAGGVTSVRDMGSDHHEMMKLSARYDNGELVGPTVYRAGFIDKTSPYSASRAVDSLEEAANKVNWYADNGYIQIKLYSSIAPVWVRPLADLAHQRGMRVGGHVPAFMTADDAVQLGFDEIQHINMLFLNFLTKKSDDTRTQLRFYLFGDAAGTLDLDSPKVQEFLKLLAERNIVVDPTVAVFDSMIGHRAGEVDPLFTAVVDRFPIGEARSMRAPGFDITDENADAWESSRLASLRMIRRLYEAGVQIVPGTDALPGFALHRELELYAKAGIPNSAILKMATLDSAAVAGVDDRSGSIEVGKNADLVLLSENPLENISAIRNPVMVLKDGRLHDPDKLLRSLGVRPAKRK